MTYPVSRRSLLTLAAGFGASTLMSASALARAPKVGTQPAYFYRFGLGNAEVTVVSDGPLPLGPPKGTFTGAADEEINRMLTDNFLSPDNIVLEQNSPIVNMGDKLVLFDTGMGTSKAFGPTTGRQQKSMAEAGIKPEDIDAVVFSHAHIDHIGGVVDETGKVLFPNAQYYIAQSDFDYWTDEGKLGSPLKDFVVHARKNLLPVRDRLVFYKDGQEFLPGVQALAAPGHTVGHTMFMVTSERQILRLPRRSHPSPDPADGKAADGILLRHRSETGRRVARENAGHAGGQQDRGHVVPLSVAGAWPCGEDRRGVSLYPAADANDALSAGENGAARRAAPFFILRAHRSNHCRFSAGLVVRDARRCRAPHHEGLPRAQSEDLILRSIAKRCVSKDEAIEVESALLGTAIMKTKIWAAILFAGGILIGAGSSELIHAQAPSLASKLVFQTDLKSIPWDRSCCCTHRPGSPATDCRCTCIRGT